MAFPQQNFHSQLLFMGTKFLRLSQKKIKNRNYSEPCHILMIGIAHPQTHELIILSV